MAPRTYRLTAGGELVALVVLLRGVNVGGHRTFRPTKETFFFS
jgi:hypothetical protein